MNTASPEHLPLIVGLILNFRDAKRTLRCVNSLLAENVEHVLVWDNSEDNEQSANELSIMLEGEARVTIAISDRNLGFSAGVNRGKEWLDEHFTNRWILLINNDAVILPGAVQLLARSLDRSESAVIAYPTIDHAGHLVGPVFYQRLFGLITFKKLPGSIAYASGCCQLLNPKRLHDVWFDEAFFMYGEDMELGNRLGECGLLHVPKMLVKHEGSASSGMGSIFYETRIVTAHWMLASKLAKNNIDLLMLYICRIFSLVLRAALRSCRYRSWVPLRSLWSGLRLACRH